MTVGRGVAVGGAVVGSNGVGAKGVEVGKGVAGAVETVALAGVETAVGGGVCDVAVAVGPTTVGTAVGAFSPPNWVQAAKASKRATEKIDAAVSFKASRPCLSGYRLHCASAT